MHAVIDINNCQIMDYSITDEHKNDSKEGIRIVRRIKNKIKELYGDKGYDSKTIYNKLEDKAVIPQVGMHQHCQEVLLTGLKVQNSSKDSMKYCGRLIIVTA